MLCCILEGDQCQNKIEGGGGGAMFCMRVIPIDGGTPLGLPEVISFFVFCTPPAIIALKWSQTCVN